MLKKIALLQKVQEKTGEIFSCLPLSANQITACALLFALAGFCLACISQPIPSLLLFILAGATDAIDGAVARAKRQVSPRGAYIDGITDRLVEFLFVLSFFPYSLPSFVLPSWLSLVSILFFGSTMSAFATAYAEHRHVADSKKIARQPGILPRAERLVLLFAALASVPFNPAISSAILFAEAVLCAATFAQRFLYFAA